MFIVLLTYVRPLEDVDRLMKQHMAFLQEGYARKIFIVSGRQVPRTGGVLLARAESRASLEAFVARDPFVQQGVATSQIIEFRASQHDPDFKTFVD